METRETRLKRLSVRSWRRGTREMDLILGPWADAHLAGLDDAAAYEALLEENDQDLLRWMLGQEPPPPAHAPLVARIAAFARDRLRPRA